MCIYQVTPVQTLSYLYCTVYLIFDIQLDSVILLFFRNLFVKHKYKYLDV
jgi:hypothetical protein